MENKDISAALEAMATLMELKGEHAFRCRSYANAARQVEVLQESVMDLIARGELDSVRGIGKGLAESIEKLVATGVLPGYAEVRAAVPDGVLEMLTLPGLGAKRVRAIYSQLGIADLEQLAQACASGAVEKLSGFGKKTAQNILQGIAYVQAHRGRVLMPVAREAAETLRAYLSKKPGAIQVEVAGSVRRCLETSKDVDIVASVNNPEALGAAFVQYGEVERVVGQGQTKVSVVLKSGLNADLRMVSEAEFPFALHHFTGSKEHNTQMRQRAKARGLKLNEYGLFKGEERLGCKDEAALFAALDLACIPPELREGAGEIEWAERGPLPDLVRMADLKGTLHVHTTWSDGRHSVLEMARAAQALGYAYIGICDHSKAAAYANGLNEDRVRGQWEEIDRVNETLEGIRVLKGIEVDILSDGRLDFEDGFLAAFDLVVASIHSKFSMTQAEATARLIRAVQHPHVDVIGHLTGRLLLSREGYPVDVRAVIDAAVAAGTAIEINAHPSRLELDWRHLSYARAQGLKVPINTDAHSVEGLADMRFGVGIARKGGLCAGDVLNALSADDLLARFTRRG